MIHLLECVFHQGSIMQSCLQQQEESSGSSLLYVNRTFAQMGSPYSAQVAQNLLLREICYLRVSEQAQDSQPAVTLLRELPEQGERLSSVVIGNVALYQGLFVCVAPLLALNPPRKL